MKKALFFCAASIWLIASCTDSRRRSNETKGAINHISIIIDDELWNGEVGDSLRNKFASPVVGLPEEEPLFTINQYPVKLLEGFMSDNRTVIVVKKEPGKRFSILQNEFGRQQNVVHLSGSTVPEIIATLESRAPSLIQMIRKAEFAEMQQRIDTELVPVPDLDRIFGISLRVPQPYRTAFKADKFLWLKKDIISGNMNVLVYELPLRKVGKFPDMRRVRDSIGERYIHGTAPESEMVTEEAYAPYVSQITIDGKKTLETRGTWELKNDFMSGPFLNFAIADPARKRLLVLEGFCYAPSKSKRDLMFELETIMRSVSFDHDKLEN